MSAKGHENSSGRSWEADTFHKHIANVVFFVLVSDNDLARHVLGLYGFIERQ